MHEDSLRIRRRGGDTESLTHLELQVKFTDDLGPLWAVNGHGVDWEFVPFEDPFRGRLGRDHDGRREVL